MTDEFLLRQTATDLFYRFTRLEEAKTTTMPSPEIKTGGGAFGSKPPGNTAAVDLDHDLCDELYEMVCNAIEEIQPTTIMHKNGGTHGRMDPMARIRLFTARMGAGPTRPH